MWCKTKINTPLMYEVLDKDTINYETLHHLSVVKCGYVSENDLLVSILSLGLYIMTYSQTELLLEKSC